MMERCRWDYLLSSSILLSLASGTVAEAKVPPLVEPLLSQKIPPTKRSSCPSSAEILASLLVRDLPSYTNRVYQRFRLSNSYMLVASRPDFEPLPLGAGQRATISETPPEPGDPHQVFITTLERNYHGGKLANLQLYHWLFLTQTDDGWRLALMYSMVGPYPAGHPPSPPQDSSEGSIAEAIRIWLRDCHANSLPASN